MKVIPFRGEHVPGAQILQETEVTVERLRSILETAVIDLEPDDEGDLYLTGGVDFPIWVRLDHDRKTIELFTFIRKVAADAATVALRLNEMNSNFALGQFHHLDDAIYSKHSVSFDGGLLPRQFVKTVRRFSGSFREAIDEMRDLLVGDEGGADWIVKGNPMEDYELAEDGSPLQELTQRIKEFIAEEACGEPYSLILDAMMNSMIHIASDARPDVTIPTILEFLMDDLKVYQAAAQQMVASGDILPAHPLDQFTPMGPKQ